MANATAAPWSVRGHYPTANTKFLIFHRKKIVASHIADLSDAELIGAAPEAFQFARAVATAVLGPFDAESLSDDPQKLIRLCNNSILPLVRRLVQARDGSSANEG